MKKLLPYLLPILTVLGILSILFIDPSVTGFVVFEKENPVIINTEKGYFLPQDALIVVSLDDNEKSLTAEEFIKKTGEEFELTEDGYTGDYKYVLDLNEFDFNLEKGEYVLEVVIKHNDEILSSDKKIIRI